MDRTDLHEFTTMLDSVCALLTRGTYSPNETSTAIFFRALAEYPMDAVRAGFTEHARRSRFSPTPADILDLLRENDGRPGEEEAWTIALTARDEADTVVWTTEIGEAWNAARIVMSMGDKVGARMAFKEAYSRMVDMARRHREPVRWVVCEGHDAARRADAVRLAVGRGLPVEGAEELLALPLPKAEVLLRIDGPAGSAVPDALRALRDRLAAGPAYVPGPDVEGRERTDELRAVAAARVAEYAASTGVELTPVPLAATAKPAPTKEAA